MKIRLLIIILLVGGTIAAISAIAADSTTRPSATTARQDDSSYSQYGRYSQQRQRNGNGRFSRNNRRDVAISSSYPASYEEVATRNIFIKGNQRPPRPDPNPTPQPYTGPAGPSPSQLVLTGVSLDSNEEIAFLEDEDANTVTRVKVGDPISNGKVVGMALDSLDYKDSGGRTVRVQVGFNLAGGDVWGVSNSTSSSSSSSTQPSRTGPRAPGESMEDYLRRRRAAEIGQ